MAEQKLRVKTGVGGTGVANVIDAAGESLVVDCEDLINISAVAIQSTDAGTVTASIDKSFDGTVWIPVGAAITEASFAAGANTAVERSLSDANGMPLICKKLRLTASALAGGGVYTFAVAGLQRPGFA